jgi:hypothetical protein
MPKWRHKARTTLQTPFGLGLSLQSRFVGKVKAETLQDNGTVGGEFNFDPGLKIKSQTYFDLAATYTLFDKVNLRAGVNNVLDNDPPLVTSGNAGRNGSNLCPTGPCNNNTYPGTWDALGRFFYLGATIDFPRRSAPIPAALPMAPAAGAGAGRDPDLCGRFGHPGDRRLPGCTAAAARPGSRARISGTTKAP